MLVDDHEILSFAPLVRSDHELSTPSGVVTRILVEDAAGGRLRPLYWVIRYSQVAVLDGHPTEWHALYLGLGVVAAALFYLALMSANVRELPAFLASAWLVVVPGISSVWIRLGPQESLGSVLLLVGALAAARGAQPRSWIGWDWIFAISISAATLVKESFALVPPALLGLRMLLFGIRRGKRAVVTRRVLVPGLATVGVGLIVAALAFNVARLSQTGSYGGGFLDAAAVSLDDTTLTNLIILGLAGGLAVPVLATRVLFDIWRYRGLTAESRGWLAGCAVACLLILPQLILYRRFGGFGIGRYMLPAALGMAAGVAAANVWSRRLVQRMVFFAVTGIWVIVVTVGGVATWRAAELFRADSVQLGRMVDVLDNEAPRGSTIAIAADPVLNLEQSVSLPYHIAARGRPDLDTRVLLTESDSPDAPQVAADFATMYFPGRTDVKERGCSELAAVVLFVSEAHAVEALPCLATAGFHLESFSDTVSLPDFMPRILSDLLPPATVDYSILRR